MSPALRSLLAGWLESGTEAQRRHAAYRLSLPDAAGADPTPIPAPSPTVAESGALLKRAKECPHMGPAPEGHCGCIGRCGLGKGAGGLVGHHDCFACLAGGSGP